MPMDIRPVPIINMAKKRRKERCEVTVILLSYDWLQEKGVIFESITQEKGLFCNQGIMSLSLGCLVLDSCLDVD